MLFMETKVLPELRSRKLDDSNFFQWSKVVKVGIIGLGVEDQLTESAPVITDKAAFASTSDDKAVQKWCQMDAQLVALLWNSMEPQVTDMSSHLGTFKEIWEYVNLLYSSDLTRMYNLSFQYFQLQQSDLSITDYFASFKRLYKELNSILSITTDVKE